MLNRFAPLAGKCSFLFVALRLTTPLRYSFIYRVALNRFVTLSLRTLRCERFSLGSNALNRSVSLLLSLSHYA
jgi:hypothetical protein